MDDFLTNVFSDMFGGDDPVAEMLEGKYATEHTGLDFLAIVGVEAVANPVSPIPELWQGDGAIVGRVGSENFPNVTFLLERGARK